MPQRQSGWNSVDAWKKKTTNEGVNDAVTGFYGVEEVSELTHRG